MLNDRDRIIMAADTKGIIMDWPCQIEIWKLLPDEQQPGWDPIMHEIIGEKQYNKRICTVKRRDIPESQLETTTSGPQYNGASDISIPSDIDIDVDCLFILDADYDNIWRVKSIKPRFGKNIVRVVKIVGETNGI